MDDLNHVSSNSLLVLLQYVSRAPPHDAYGGGPPPPPRGTCSPSFGMTGGTARAAAATATFGTGGGRRGGWLWADRDRYTDTLTRVGVCEALPSVMQGGGQMATSLRRDGMHVSGNAAAMTTQPTHTITTAIAAAAATRRAAGQECSMAYISTPHTCTAAVGCAHAGGAVGALSRRAPETKTDRGGDSESRIRLLHLGHDMYVLQIKCDHVAHRRSLSARAGMISMISR